MKMEPTPSSVINKKFQLQHSLYSPPPPIGGVYTEDGWIIQRIDTHQTVWTEPSASRHKKLSGGLVLPSEGVWIDKWPCPIPCRRACTKRRLARTGTRDAALVWVGVHEAGHVCPQPTCWNLLAATAGPARPDFPIDSSARKCHVIKYEPTQLWH